MQNLARDNYEATEDDWRPVILDIREMLKKLESAAADHADRAEIIAENRRLEAEKAEQRRKEAEREREEADRQVSRIDRWAA